MNKSKSTYNVGLISSSSLEAGNNFDNLEHRFGDLLVNFSSMSHESTDNSEGLFKEIKSCKNITFTRSRSYFDDALSTPFPVTPARTADKHALLTSDEEDIHEQNDDQCSKINSTPIQTPCSVPRSPLKVYSYNSLATPKLAEKSAKRNVSKFLCDSAHKPSSQNLSRYITNNHNRPTVTLNDDSLNKENLNTMSIAVSPHSSRVPNSTLDGLSHLSPLVIEKTPILARRDIKTMSRTSTPFNSSVTSNLIFNTPDSSSKTAKPQLSAQKRYSIDKAVASARREFEEMARTMKLRKSILKSNQKEINSSILDASCEFSASLNADNSIFTTPPTTTKKDNKTPIIEKKLKNCNNLTGIKKLDQQNEIQPSPTPKQNYNAVNGVTNDRKLFCANNCDDDGDEDDDDDLPSTQPASSVLLRNVVAYVEVRWGRDYMSEGTKAELESLGAKVEKNFTRKVTHCFFHGGKMSTYRKAIEWKVPLVSTLWIEACKAAMQVLPFRGYEPHGLDKYKEELPLYKLKTKGLRRAVTDSKIRRRPWKEDEVNKKTTQAAASKPLPPVPTFSETEKVIDALHSVAGDLRKATNQFEKILTSPVLQKKQSKEKNKSGVSSKTNAAINTSNCRRKRNKKLVFGSSSDDDKKEEENNPTASETVDRSSKVSDFNDSEVRISYDSDDLLAYAKKQAANSRSSAPPRLLTSRKCKKLLSSCKDPEKKNGVVSSGAKVNEEVNSNSRITRRSKNQAPDGKINEKEQTSQPTQTKKRKLLLPAQVIANFEQDSGESTPPVSPKNPYKATPNKKPRTGLAPKSKTVRTLVSVKVTSDCDSDDSLTRAARRESSALFVKKDKKTNPQKTSPTIVCTSLSRSDEDVVKSIVAQLGTFTVEAAVSERTTHVVTPSPRRTINLLKGIARGCWVLNVKWVYKSLEAGQWLPEEKYELTEFSPAVKMARCDRQAFGPEFGLELFSGLGPFYVCRATVPPARDLAELLRLGGGCVVSNARAAKVVVGTTAPLSPYGRPAPLMVKEKWVLDCITRLTQLDMTDYAAVVDSEP